MAKNEKTGKKAGTIGSKLLKGKSVTKNQLKTAGASLITQRPDKKKSK